MSTQALVSSQVIATGAIVLLAAAFCAAIFVAMPHP